MSHFMNPTSAKYFFGGFIIFLLFTSFLPLVTATDECNGCSREGHCYSYGIRKDRDYCSLSGTFTEQKNELRSCENNFECASNVCVDNKCVSAGFLKKIFIWLEQLLFGK